VRVRDWPHSSGGAWAPPVDKREFARTFFSGPTEIRFFNGLVVDGDQTGEPDSAAVELSADAPIPCTDSGTNAFLDDVATPVMRGKSLFTSVLTERAASPGPQIGNSFYCRTALRSVN
jgi:hypothetical protein